MVDTLKVLISKLSTGEKKYFSIISKLICSTDYNALYKNILSYGNINIDKLKEEVKDNSFIKYISIRKEFLLDKILYSLVNHHFENSIKWKIQKDILFAKILIEKEILEKANHFLSNAKNNAYKYEEYELLLQIISIEISLCFNDGFILNYDKLKELKKEQKKVNDIVDTLTNLLTIKAELQQYQFAEVIDKVDINNFTKIYGHTPVMLVDDLISQRTKSICLYNNCIYSFLLHDYELAFDYHTKHYELYKKYPEFFERKEAMQLLNNFMYCCCLTHKEDLFNQLVNELTNIKKQTKEESLYIKRAIYIRKLEFYHHLKRYKEANSFAFVAENYLNNGKSDKNTFNTKYLQLLIIRAFIENNNFNAAIAISLKRYKIVGPDFSSSILKLFEYIAHYKLGNYDYLLYSIDSWVKTIQSKRKQFPAEKVMIKFFRKVCNITNNEDKKNLIKDTIIQLKELEKSNMKFFIKHYFDFAVWFERELEEMN